MLARSDSALVLRTFAGKVMRSGNENAEKAACWLRASEGPMLKVLRRTGSITLRADVARFARSEAAAPPPKFAEGTKLTSRAARSPLNRCSPELSGSPVQPPARDVQSASGVSSNRSRNGVSDAGGPG